MKKLFVLGLTATAIAATGIVAGMCPGCKGAPNPAAPSGAFSISAPIAADASEVNAPAELKITAKSAFLVEANSGKVLFAKDEYKRLPIASMVKITTLAVIYDALEAGAIKMDDMVTVSREASGMGGSQAFLDFDSEYKVSDLIKSIIIASANDSCVAMAETIAGSESEFVTRMNALAAKLGMENTNYVNCTGLPAAGAYSCAADVAKIYQYIMKSPYYAYVAEGETQPFNKTWMYDLTHPSGRVTGLTNTNKHSRFFNGCEGGKTGFTAEAGHCITVTATRGAMKPVAVIIGADSSQTRFAESGNLMNHVFSGYENKLLVDASKPLGSIKLKNAVENFAAVRAKNNFYDLVKKGDKDAAPTVTVQVNKSAKAPLGATDTVGKVIVTENGTVIGEVDLITGSAISELGYWDAVKKIAGSYKIS